MPKFAPRRVTVEWTAHLPMQQQSVLLLALRGPDGFPKFHDSKHVLRAYRGCVIKAALYGRELHSHEVADSFMSFEHFRNTIDWEYAIEMYFNVVDEMPMHYHLHLTHAIEILAYKHPNSEYRERWMMFYKRAVHAMHMTPETEEEMDKRLGDWNQDSWE